MFVPRSVTKGAGKPPDNRSIVKKATNETINKSETELQLTANEQSVSHEETCNSAGPSAHEYANEAAVETSSTSETEDDEPVVSYSKLQRWPEAGEPVCVVCGRYGAYIVDKTDNDVCSLECKAKHLLKYGISVATSNNDGSSVTNEAIEDDGNASWVYRDHPEVAGMSENQVMKFREKVSV